MKNKPVSKFVLCTYVSQLHNYLLDEKIVDCISAHVMKILIIISQKRQTREDTNNRKHAKSKQLINVHACVYVCLRDIWQCFPSKQLV